MNFQPPDPVCKYCDDNCSGTCEGAREAMSTTPAAPTLDEQIKWLESRSYDALMDAPESRAAIMLEAILATLRSRPNEGMREALELHKAWEALPTDRGGKDGPKMRAYAAFTAARNAALALPAAVAPAEKPEVSQRVAQQIIRVRAALIVDDNAEANHQLYKIASPNFDSLTPWAELEALAGFTTDSLLDEALAAKQRCVPIEQARGEEDDMRAADIYAKTSRGDIHLDRGVFYIEQLIHAAYANGRSRGRALSAPSLEDARDAARYRWLRAENPKGHVSSKAAQGSRFIRMGVGAFSYELPAEADLDAAIDAARSKP